MIKKQKNVENVFYQTLRTALLFTIFGKTNAMGYKLKKEEDGVCLECGTNFHGRKDKKFCCLECKNTYNNRRHRQIRLYRTEVTEKISRNYQVLEMLLVENIKSAELETLRRLGFDPDYFTSSHKNGKRHQECCCFDIIYCISERKIFNIERMDLTI